MNSTDLSIHSAGNGAVSCRAYIMEYDAIHHVSFGYNQNQLGPSQIQNVLTDNWYWLNLRMNYKLNLNTVD